MGEGALRTKRVVCFNLMFPDHHNVRTLQIRARLSDSVRFYQATLSRRRLIRAVQYRVWCLLKRALIYPVLLRSLSRRYERLLTFDPLQASAWSKPDSVIVDTDDPMFTEDEIRALNQPQVRAVIVTTEQAKTAFRDLGVHKSVHVVPQGMDFDLLDPAKIRSLGHSYRQGGDVVAGYLAPSLTLSEDGPRRWRRGQDDLDFLFAAFEKAREREPGLKLWLIGRASDSVRKYASGKSWLRVFGYVPFAETYNYLANLDIGLYPRTQALPIRFPFKIGQYMACGVAVVSTESYFVREEPYCGIYADSEEAFSNAVVDLARFPEKRAAFASAGKRYAESHLHWSRLIRRYEEILR